MVKLYFANYYQYSYQWYFTHMELYPSEVDPWGAGLVPPILGYGASTPSPTGAGRRRSPAVVTCRWSERRNLGLGSKWSKIRWKIKGHENIWILILNDFEQTLETWALRWIPMNGFEYFETLVSFMSTCGLSNSKLFWVVSRARPWSESNETLCFSGSIPSSLPCPLDTTWYCIGFWNSICSFLLPVNPAIYSNVLVLILCCDPPCLWVFFQPSSLIYSELGHHRRQLSHARSYSTLRWDLPGAEVYMDRKDHPNHSGIWQFFGESMEQKASRIGTNLGWVINELDLANWGKFM